MSLCCKLAPSEHEATCANNPKNFGAAPDAEPKAAAERKLMDPESLKHFGDELRSLQASYLAQFARSKAEGK